MRSDNGPLTTNAVEDFHDSTLLYRK